MSVKKKREEEERLVWPYRRSVSPARFVHVHSLDDGILLHVNTRTGFVIGSRELLPLGTSARA